jgi:hypothetical protein
LLCYLLDLVDLHDALELGEAHLSRHERQFHPPANDDNHAAIFAVKSEHNKSDLSLWLLRYRLWSIREDARSFDDESVLQ